MIDRHDSVLLHFVVRAVMVPAILLFGLYVLVHGEVSPGGGFQAGAILAAGLILSRMSLSSAEGRRLFSRPRLVMIAVLGMLLYTGTGVAAMLSGGDYLDYGAIAFEWIDRIWPGDLGRRHIGVFIIEVGVTLAVFGTLALAADYLTEPHEPEETEG